MPDDSWTRTALLMAELCTEERCDAVRFEGEGMRSRWFEPAQTLVRRGQAFGTLRAADQPAADPAIGSYTLVPVVGRDGERALYGVLIAASGAGQASTARPPRALIALAGQLAREHDLERELVRTRNMQREAEHRIKNALQTLLSFVRLRGVRAKDPPVGEALADVARRIASTALVHEEMRTGALAGTVDLKHFLDKLARLLADTCPTGVTLDGRFEPFVANAEQASALAAIANEFVANSIKHAFPGERAGRITLDLVARGSDGSAALVMADDGVGSPQTTGTGGLGTRIIAACADQLGATLTTADAKPGVRLTLTLPAGALTEATPPKASAA